MKLTAWIAIASQMVSVTQGGALLSIPYFLEVHDSSFSVTDWGHWVRVITYGITLINPAVIILAFTKMRRSIIKVTLGVEVLIGLLLTFNLVFGSRTPSQALCDDWDGVCLEQSGDFTVCSIQNDDSIDNWQGLLFIIGTCIALTMVPWLVMEALDIDNEGAVFATIPDTIRNKDLTSSAPQSKFEQPEQPKMIKDNQKHDTFSASSPDSHGDNMQRVFEPVGQGNQLVTDDKIIGTRPVVIPGRRGANRRPIRGSVNIPLH